MGCDDLSPRTTRDQHHQHSANLLIDLGSIIKCNGTRFRILNKGRANGFIEW